jgi:hypothetical protein
VISGFFILLDMRGIEIPFPHRTIYWGEPVKGQTASSHVVRAPARDSAE